MLDAKLVINTVNCKATRILAASILKQSSNFLHVNLSEGSQVNASLLEHLPRSIKSLVLRNCEKIDDKAVEQISRLTYLTSLDLSGCKKITAKGLRNLSSLKNLKFLDLARCDIKEPDLHQIIKNFTWLESIILPVGGIYSHEQYLLKYRSKGSAIKKKILGKVNIGNTGGFDQQWKALSDMYERREKNSKVTKISKEYAYLSGVENAQIKQLHAEIEKLEISSKLVTSNGFSEIGNLKKLRQLSLENCTRICPDIGLYLQGLTELTSLNLKGCSLLSVSSAASIASNLENLKELTLPTGQHIKSPESIRECIKTYSAKEVNTKNIKIRTALSAVKSPERYRSCNVFEGIKQTIEARRIRARNIAKTETAMKEMYKKCSVKLKDIKASLEYGNFDKKVISLRKIKSDSSIRTLEVNSVSAPSAYIERIPKSVEILVLKNSHRLSEKAIKNLAKFEKLKYLGLISCKILSYKAIKSLRSLKALEVLSFKSSRISPEGSEDFVNLKLYEQFLQDNDGKLVVFPSGDTMCESQETRNYFKGLKNKLKVKQTKFVAMATDKEHEVAQKLKMRSCLKHIVFSNCVNLSEEIFNSLPNDIETLDIRGLKNIGNTALPLMTKFKRLQEIKLSGSGITDHAFEQIAHKFENLNLAVLSSGKILQNDSENTNIAKRMEFALLNGSFKY